MPTPQVTYVFFSWLNVQLIAWNLDITSLSILVFAIGYPAHGEHEPFYDPDLARSPSTGPKPSNSSLAEGQKGSAHKTGLAIFDFLQGQRTFGL